VRHAGRTGALDAAGRDRVSVGRRVGLVVDGDGVRTAAAVNGKSTGNVAELLARGRDVDGNVAAAGVHGGGARRTLDVVGAAGRGPVNRQRGHVGVVVDGAGVAQAGQLAAGQGGGAAGAVAAVVHDQGG